MVNCSACEILCVQDVDSSRTLTWTWSVVTPLLTVTTDFSSSDIYSIFRAELDVVAIPLRFSHWPLLRANIGKQAHFIFASKIFSTTTRSAVAVAEAVAECQFFLEQTVVWHEFLFQGTVKWSQVLALKSWFSFMLACYISVKKLHWALMLGHIMTMKMPYLIKSDSKSRFVSMRHCELWIILWLNSCEILSARRDL